MDPFLRNWTQVSDSGTGLLLVVAESLNAWINVTWSCSSCIRMTFSQGSLTGPTMGFLISCRHKWYRRVQHCTVVSLGEFVKLSLFFEALMAGCISTGSVSSNVHNGPLFHLSLFLSLSLRFYLWLYLWLLWCPLNTPQPGQQNSDAIPTSKHTPTLNQCQWSKLAI